jgi:SAM-dependent methyltransferase
MNDDEIKWNQRYAAGTYPTEPHEAVQSFYSLAKIGNAMDIAAGNGRNSIFLAEQGFQVDAVDISSMGLKSIEKNDLGIRTIHADLNRYLIANSQYDLIVNTNFLLRRLFPLIISGLKENGILIFQTYLDPALTGGKVDPEKQDRYLKPNELLHAFLELHILYFQEKVETFDDGRKLKAAVLVAKKETLSGLQRFS